MKTLLIFLLSISFCLAQTSQPKSQKQRVDSIRQRPNEQTKYVRIPSIWEGDYTSLDYVMALDNGGYSIAPLDFFQVEKIVKGDTLMRHTRPGFSEFASFIGDLKKGHLYYEVYYVRKDDEPASLTHGQLKQILERLRKLEEPKRILGEGLHWSKPLYLGDENDFDGRKNDIHIRHQK